MLDKEQFHELHRQLETSLGHGTASLRMDVTPNAKHGWSRHCFKQTTVMFAPRCALTPSAKSPCARQRRAIFGCRLGALSLPSCPEFVPKLQQERWRRRILH